MNYEEIIMNLDPQIILGLIGSGFLLAWISELIFSIIGLFTQFIIKKIKGINKEDV